MFSQQGLGAMLLVTLDGMRQLPKNDRVEMKGGGGGGGGHSHEHGHEHSQGHD